MQKLWIILTGVLILALAGYLLKKLVVFSFYFWEQTQHALRKISRRLAQVIGFLLRRSRSKVVIASKGRVFLLFVLVSAGFFSVQHFLRGWTLLLAALLSMGLSILVLIAKIVMLQEDSQIMNGILVEENALFRDLQGAIPTSVLVLASSVFFASFVLTVAAFDALFPGTLFAPHASVDFLDWLVSVLLQFELLKNMTSYVVPGHFSLMQTTQTGQLLFSMILPVLFGFFVYGAVTMQYRQIMTIHQIVHALRKEDANIQFVQRRAALAPSQIKTQLINMALHDEDPVVRKRVISVAHHAPIYSFPQAFISHVHREKEEDIKRKGLKVCYRMLKNEAIHYNQQRRLSMLRSIRYQQRTKRRKHSEKIQELLAMLEQELAS